MDVKLSITVDLGDRTTALIERLLGGAPGEPEMEVHRVEPEKETPPRKTRARKMPEAPPVQDDRAPAEELDPRDDAQVQDPEREISIDDIRGLAAEVLEADESKRPAVLKKLGEVGAKGFGGIPEDRIEDFYSFLKTLKDK